MSATAPNDYLRNRILQATPEQLHLMLYDGAIRFATQGRDAILRKDYEEIYEKLTRAQHIVLEMQLGLKPDVHPELCEQMSGLYNFVYRKLVDACVHRNASDVDDALKILRHQRETWVMLIDKVNAEREGDESEVPASTANATQIEPQPTQSVLSIEG